MDWLSPVNAGTESCLVLKGGDRLFCRYCDAHILTMRYSVAHGATRWNDAFEFVDREQPEFGAVLPFRCIHCGEVAMIYANHQGIAAGIEMETGGVDIDAPLEMRRPD